MSTIEKLIVQIFERKNSIIEQVKHQVELYDQQLASKLVIQGIDIPSWLWNQEAPFHSSDPSELNKQRLISELLLPLPQQAVPYFNNFNFNSISIPECNFDQLEEGKNPNCSDDVYNVLDIPTEVGLAASSPQQQVATKLDDGNSGVDLSRADFKRSKSRQRALELRSSAKSGAKSREQDGNISVVSYRNDTPCMDEFIQRNNLEEADSAIYLYNQVNDSPMSEGVKTSFRIENNATRGYGNIDVPNENACSITELVGTIFSEQINKPMESENPFDMPQEEDAGSAGIMIQSCNVNNYSRVCKSGSYGSESSGQIIKPTKSACNLSISRDGDAESEGISIRRSEENNTSEEIPNRQLEHACGSIVKPTRFQETSDNQLGCGKILCSTETEDSASEAKPSQQNNHEMDFSELDLYCTSKTVGIGSGGQIDESLTEEIPLDAAHGKCSTDATLDVNKLSTSEEVLMPSRISSSKISSKKLLDVAPSFYAAKKDTEKVSAVSLSSLQDNLCVLESLDLMTPLMIDNNNSGMMKVQIKGHSSSDKTLRKLSANPVKLEISPSKNAELICNFPALENDGGITEASLSCDLSNSHDHVLRSVQRVSPAVSTADTDKESDKSADRKNSPKSSRVNTELRTSSPGLEGRNSLHEELNTLNAEVEVPQIQVTTVEQPDLQKEDAKSTACDYGLLKGVVLDQENLHIVRSVSFLGTSKTIEDSSDLQENIVVEENSESEPTTSTFVVSLRKVETMAPTLSSCEANQATDVTVMIEEGSECFLEGSHLSLDFEANLNKEQYIRETFSSGSAVGGESYADAFEENAFTDAKYDDMMDVDQSMPIFEGFVMETDDEESMFAGGQIDIEDSSSTLRRASVLERICQSSSRNTPVSEFPMTFGLHKTSDLFQSVPTGLLEHISLVGDSTNMKGQHKSYSAGLPVSTDPFSFNVSTPPFKKKWVRSTSSSGLKSQGSLNPELVCFTIEEDPGNFDETGNHDEVAEARPSHNRCLKSSLKRKPLTDITEDGNNLHLSAVSLNKKDVLEVGQTPIFRFRSQLDSTGTEANVIGAQTRTRQKLGEILSNKKRRVNDKKEYRNLSVGTNGGHEVTHSLKETKAHKPKYSENQKTITGVSDNQKVTRNNNIVSNISSFIPLVQQKKAAAAAAVVTGKRDVKVKALEAAEAAKRLAEKKENERKAKKEAWKAEKARLEQENLLQLELKKKKKEEELKKKEADIAARKRIREEEEKKEKEGKRRRVEVARKQQHEQGKKQADKLIKHQADGLRTNENDPNNGLEQCTKVEAGGRKDRVTTESVDKSATVACNTKTMLSDLKVLKEACNLDAKADKNPKDMPEVLQSYDISPYNGSDDECEDDDDENDRRKEKFVPSWASKNNLAEAVFSQRHINPDEILPPESFCSIAEVLIPRKQLVK